LRAAELLDEAHEVVNINLKSKPDWFLAKTSLGLVPVLEQDDKIVFESAICDEYLDEVYGKRSLLPQDPYSKARAKIMLATFASKVTPKFYSMLKECSEEDKIKQLQELQDALKSFEEELCGTYFGGTGPSMLDYEIWPFFERFPMLTKLHGVDPLPEDKFPKLSKWVEAMMQLPAVKQLYHDPDRYVAWSKSRDDGNPDYDLGL